MKTLQPLKCALRSMASLSGNQASAAVAVAAEQQQPAEAPDKSTFYVSIGTSVISVIYA